MSQTTIIIKDLGKFVDSMYDVAEEIVADMKAENELVNPAWLQRLTSMSGPIDQYQGRKALGAGAVLTKYGVEKIKSAGGDPSDNVYGKPLSDK